MLFERVRRVVEEWASDEGRTDLPAWRLERPTEQSHGDYATALCMQLAKKVGCPPRSLAETLRQRLLQDEEIALLVDGLEVAGPGFLNFTLSARAYTEIALRMLAEGDAFGGGDPTPEPRINLEFVSVNPNGPLHVGHGRYAAYGDSLRRLMVFSGANVSTEFYINDFGRQMDRFGKSVAARYAQLLGIALEVPQDGYWGEYVKDVAAAVRAEVGDHWAGVLGRVAEARVSAAELPGGAQTAAEIPGRREAVAGVVPILEDEDEFPADDAGGDEWPVDSDTVRMLSFFRTRARDLMLDAMRSELREFGVEFDVWFSETSLHEDGRLENVISRLLDAGEVYSEGEALWLRTTARGDDKDRVLIRSNSCPTYFAADIAYHEDKLSRGFDHLIDIWGADHHGYVPRMKAAVEILAGRPGVLEVIIGQLVNLLDEGELRQMSTRRGEMVTLKELVDAIGVDAARFFLVMRSHDQTLDLDIGLARHQSQENPVYYVQYAHARIAGILRNAPGDLLPEITPGRSIFESPHERGLIKRLESFPSVVREAADRRAPHRIVGFAQELAADFHVFYKHCRVLGEPPEVASSRLALCLVTKRVIGRCLDLLGVGAPERM